MKQMRYIKNRGNFNLINESGPLANDVKWGDSLIGRLINSSLRKASIEKKKWDISRAISGLTDALDEILMSDEMGKGEVLNDSETMGVFIKSLLHNLAKAIDDEREPSEIVKIAEDTISDIKSSNLENKDEFIKRIEQLIDFINQFNKNIESDNEKIDVVGGDEAINIKYENEFNTSKALDIMRRNLTSLQLTLQYQTLVKVEGLSKDSDYFKINQGEIKRHIYKTKQNDTVQKIINDKSININSLSWEQILTKNTKVLNGKKINTPLESDLVLVLEGIKKEGHGKFILLYKNDEQAIKSFINIKKSINSLLNEKDKGISINEDFLKEIINNNKDGREQIKNLYKNINRYLIGDAKATLPNLTPESLLENIETISDKRKSLIVAEKIARFANSTLRFEENNSLYSALGDFGKHLQSFNTTIKQIMSLGTDKKEKFMSSYDMFVSYIKEQDESVGEKSLSLKIKEKFQELFKPEEYGLLQKEVDLVNNKIDSNKSKNKNNPLTIEGEDHVIDIVRAFNKAYKAHTTMVIPTGRSGGKVSNSVFLEYTPLGKNNSPTPESAGKDGGPYRHNTTFNKWEEGVLSILKDPKYSNIFKKDSVIIVNGEKKDKFGTKLKRFMLDMLDGDKLYTDGAQSKYLKEYFGIDSKDSNTTEKKKDKEDINDITKIVSKIDKITLDLVRETPTIKQGMFLTIRGIDDNGKNKIRNIFIRNLDNSDKVYILYGYGYKFFLECIKNKYKSPSFDENNTLINKSAGDINNIYLSYVSKSELSKISNGEISFSGIDTNGRIGKDNIKFKIKEIYILKEKDSGEYLTLQNDNNIYEKTKGNISNSKQTTIK
jgi:hypothetical protein